MKVRTRLVLSFAYILLVVIVALTIPLGIVLRDRARSELESLVLTNSQTIAVLLDDNRVGNTARDRRALARSVQRYAQDVGGRVVVMDARGTVVADSHGEDLGKDFATEGSSQRLDHPRGARPDRQRHGKRGASARRRLEHAVGCPERLGLEEPQARSQRRRRSVHVVVRPRVVFF